MDVDKNYETVFILDPSLTQKDAEQTFKNIKDFITDNEDIFFKRNDTVIRFIICNLDKNGISYNDNRRKNKGKVINNQKVLNLI